MAKTLLTVAFVIALAVDAALFQGYGAPPSPGRPGAAPGWTRIVKLSDGRTFITDGGMTLDVTHAKPATLPTDAVAASAAKTVEGHLGAALPVEVGLARLDRAPSGHYAAPNKIVLNAGYVDYLRRVLPPPRVRLRMKTELEPVVILLDGKPVGLIMPMRS